VQVSQALQKPQIAHLPVIRFTFVILMQSSCIETDSNQFFFTISALDMLRRRSFSPWLIAFLSAIRSAMHEPGNFQQEIFVQSFSIRICGFKLQKRNELSVACLYSSLSCMPQCSDARHGDVCKDRQRAHKRHQVGASDLSEAANDQSVRRCHCREGISLPNSALPLLHFLYFFAHQ
jgi:hypothetical protein